MKSTRAAKRKRKSAASRYGSVEIVDVHGDRMDRRRWQEKMMEWSSQEKKKFPFDYLAGEIDCPSCTLRMPTRNGGCNMFTCLMTNYHRNGKEAHFCGHCLQLSSDNFSRCSCRKKWDRQAREEEELKKRMPIDSDDDGGGGGTSSHFASDQSGTGSDFHSADPSYVSSPKSEEHAVNEDRDITAVEDHVAQVVKQEPDAVTIMPYDYDEETVVDVDVQPPEDIKSAAIPPVKVKSEGAKAKGSEYDEDTDGEGASSLNDKNEEEEDQQDSKRRKMGAAVSTSRSSVSRKPRNVSSTRNSSVSAARANKVSKTNEGNKTSVKRKRQSLEKDGCDLKNAAKKKKRYECSSPGCTNIVKKGGVCIRHGANVKRCSSEGCTNQAQKGGVCMRHGAKVERCSKEGCTNYVVRGGVCIRHGAKVEPQRCSRDGCTNYVQRGGVCIRHGAKVEHKRCCKEGCTNIVKKGGVCIRHGAKVKRCSSEGCTNYVQKGGVCRRHGAKVRVCSSEGCTNHAKKGGVCKSKSHGAKVL